MIKTIIVDDEVWVCKLICNIIDWEQYGFTIIGQAHNGNEAMKLISEVHPDLVFTDIRMPGMDGLEVAKKTAELGLDTKFVIISGYSDFSYAKSAIEQGVFDYLLKPVEPNDLIALLKRLRTQLDQEFEKETTLQNQLEKSKRYSLSHFFLNYLTGNAKLLTENPIEYLNSEYNSTFSEGLFQAFQIILDENIATTADMNQDVLKHIMMKWYDQLQPICFEVCVFEYNLSVVCVANYDAQSQKSVELLVRDVFKYCRMQIPNIYRYSITLGMGIPQTGFLGIPASFQSAQDAVRSRIVKGTNRVITAAPEAEKFTSQDISALFTAQYRNQLIRYIEQTEHSDAQDIIDDILQKCQDTTNPSMIFTFALHTIDVIYTTMCSAAPSFLEQHPRDHVEQSLEACHSISQISEFLANLLQEARQTNEMQNNSTTSIITMLQDYIDEHYSENISLDDLASHVYLSAKYISEIFKKKTGVNFSDYLVSRRIEMAKRFLQDPRYRISDISEMVGYHDSKHFSKLFKKMTGITPAQYRKLYSN